MKIWLLLFAILFCGLALPAQDLYDLEKIVEIKIHFSDPDWERKLHTLKEAGEDERLIGDVWVNGQKYSDAGIRYKGNSSYFNVRKAGLKKLPFNIKVNFTQRGQKLPGGYSTLKLSNGFRDPSFLREVLAYEVAAQYMPAPVANFAKVWLNEEYLGLYNLTQSVDDDLLERFFGHDEGILFKCDPTWNGVKLGNCPESDKASLQYIGADTICYRNSYELKSKGGGWPALVDFTRVLNQQPERLEEVLNIDETLWMLAFDNVTVNLDSYIGRLCHNYYLYRDTLGIHHPMIWDMNLCFGGFRYTGLGPPLDDDKLESLSLFLHFKEQNEKRPLILQLLRNDLYRKVYVAHVKTLLEEQFAGERFAERALRIHRLIAGEIAADPYLLYDKALFVKNLTESVQIDEEMSIPSPVQLMQKRATYLLGHPLMQFPAPAVEAVVHTVEGEQVSFSAQASDAQQVWLFYRAGSYQPWKRLPLSATASAWAGQLPAAAVQHYYIVAEGAKAATVVPARASKAYYEVVVK